MKRILTLFALCLPLFAQFPAADGITVTASRNVQLALDQIFLNVNVAADIDSTVEAVVQAVQSTGITADDLTGVQPFFGPPGQTPGRVTYTFFYATPLARFKETIAKLDTARRALLAGTSNMELQYFPGGLASSEPARQEARQRVLADLLADVKAKAELVAKAAGVTLGPILGMTDLSGPEGLFPVRATFYLTVRYAVRP